MTHGRFIDANVFLRHFLGDDPRMSVAATDLLMRVADGSEVAWTSASVVAEVVWVLSGRMYNRSREEVATEVGALMSLPALHIEGKAMVQRAFALYAGLKVDFIDALTAADVAQADPPELYSFDRDFDRIPGVRRLAPDLR